MQGQDPRSERDACSHEVTCIDGVMRYPENVECVGESSDGCTDYFKCHECGRTWSIRHND